jgi:hypothetical protein
MKNLPFVIWMVGAPAVETFGDYVHKYLLKKTYSIEVAGIAAIIFLAMYFFIGYKLYEKKS